MTRRLAMAVIWAITNLFGSTDLNDWSMDVDDADDGIVDLADAPERADRPEQAAVLQLASIACGEQIDRAWIFGNIAHPAGAVAIHIAGQIAYLNLAVRSSSTDAMDIASTLLPPALAACRDLGMLRVSIGADPLDPAALTKLAESCGYHFSRTRQIEGVPVSDFYTNLYWRSASPRTTT